MADLMPIYKRTPAPIDPTFKVPVVANYTALIAIASPVEGMQALTQDQDLVWTYTALPAGNMWLPPPGTHIMQLIRGATQSCLTGAQVPIIWEATNYVFNPSVANQFWNSATPTRILIGWRGKYRFDTTTSFAPNATGYRKHTWSLNGNPLDYTITTATATTQAPGPAWTSSSFQNRLLATDYVESVVSHSAGSNLNAAVSGTLLDLIYMGP